MDLTIIFTGIGIVITVIGANIALFTWLRSDIGSLESKFESKINSLENKFESKINSLEERMFYLATGKSLSQAILEEKMKVQKKVE